jgi:hypothetical protein
MASTVPEVLADFTFAFLGLVQSRRRRDSDGAFNGIIPCSPIAIPHRVLDSVRSPSNHDVRVGHARASSVRSRQ